MVTENISIVKENSFFRNELSDLKRDYERAVAERDAFRTKVKEIDSSQRNLWEKYQKMDVIVTGQAEELKALSSKVIEGEYSAFCYTIKERSVLNDQPKDIQLILRKNTQGEAILEFENKNGDIRFIKADLVTDVESDPEDPLRFSIKYRVFTCNISNMAVSASRLSIPLKPSTEEG